jgi:ferric-dicitrate binding protein FerR (iron transport regulator)
LENNDECESVTEAKRRKRAEYQKQYRLSKKLEKESMLMQHDTNECESVTEAKRRKRAEYLELKFQCRHGDIQGKCFENK